MFGVDRPNDLADKADECTGGMFLRGGDIPGGAKRDSRDDASAGNDALGGEDGGVTECNMDVSVAEGGLNMPFVGLQD